MAGLACARCAGDIDPGDRFCPNCGAEVEIPDSTGVIPAIDISGPLPAIHTGDDLRPGEAALIVLRGSVQGERFLLDADLLVIGRADESDVFLDDVTVSRRHAVIAHGKAGWSITDDDSLNGTFVNRSVITGTVPLQAGDELQIGKYRLLFAEAGRS